MIQLTNDSDRNCGCRNGDGGVRALGIRGLVNQPGASRRHLPKAVLGPERGSLGRAGHSLLNSPLQQERARLLEDRLKPTLPCPQRWQLRCQNVGSLQREHAARGRKVRSAGPAWDTGAGPWGHPSSRQMAGPLLQRCLQARARPSNRQEAAGVGRGQALRRGQKSGRQPGV